MPSNGVVSEKRKLYGSIDFVVIADENRKCSWKRQSERGGRLKEALFEAKQAVVLVIFDVQEFEVVVLRKRARKMLYCLNERVQEDIFGQTKAFEVNFVIILSQLIGNC